MKNFFVKILKNRVYYLFLAPFYFFFIYFVVVPAVKLFYYSLFRINNVGFQLKFSGIYNYIKIFSDFRFWAAFRNTTLLVVVLIPMVVVISLFIANSIHREKNRLKTYIRAAIYIPAVTAEVVLVMTWKYIYNPKYGILNYILSLFRIPPQDWMGTTTLAPLSLTIVILTFSLGSALIIYLAAIGSIPESYYEAALLDGANNRQMFFRITLPLLQPTTVFIIISNTIGYFQIFSTPFLMTGGGPLNSTSTLVLLLYKTAFYYYNLGGAAVIGVVLFIICGLIAFFQYKYLARNISY